MRTTMDVQDNLLIEAKRLAAERRTTLTAVVEDGLRAVLGQRLREGPATLEAWPISTRARPVDGLDYRSSAALSEAAEDPRPMYDAGPVPAASAVSPAPRPAP
jgi:hypothetical protein